MNKNVGGYDRLLRTVLAGVLTTIALGAFRGGNQMKGLLAGVGALAFGFNATTCFCGLNQTLGIDTTSNE